jgi:murein DD-endopeptidase MepM/ murein hydrolase activator NlpD
MVAVSTSPRISPETRAVRSFAIPALALLALATLGGSASTLPALRITLPGPASRPLAALDGDSECPPGSIPDGDVCVHLPGAEGDVDEALASANIHRERSGRWAAYEQIPRRPDRPASYDAYRYPIPPGLPNGHYVVSGYDLDQPDSTQRRGRTLHAVGHGGVDLPQARGTLVKLVALEHQQGNADVVYVGALFGTTVVTRHTLREGGRLRDYLLLFGHLDAAASGVSVGTTLKDGDLIGYVGDTGSPELVHLHLEVRRVREGIDVSKRTAGGGSLLGGDVSVVCDPRNVLPLL